MSETATPTLTGSAIRLPVATLPATVLPGSVVTLTLSSDELRTAIAAARHELDPRVVLRVGSDDTLVVVAQVPDVGNLPTGDPAAVISIQGRARITSLHPSERGSTFAEIELIADPRPTPRVEALARELRGVLGVIADLRRSRRLPDLLRTVTQPGALADDVATWAEFDDAARADVLAAVDVADRVQLVLDWARNHVAELQVAESIRNDVTEGVDKQQREYLLRQQLAAIRKELGEGDDDVVAEYRERLAGMTLPETTYNAIAKEIDRLERMSSQSPEHGWIRSWLDRVFELPWDSRSEDNLDLANVQAVLDADHYGLDDVKARIVEYMAVRKLRAVRHAAAEASPDAPAEASTTPAGRHAGAIITLVGPPGVGKTSLGESVARAMGRRFVRVALGGIRDEAEIRGHRRTYVGSQPGRIAKAMTEAGTSNPVILLDEVDKLSAGGWSGDPTAALLEVLDPAQNHTFRDHYLELDLDLSDVVFIATANILDTIPAPLLDRMEVVRLDGYTDDEKVFIARRYLLPRQLDRAGMRPDELTVDDDTIRAVVRQHTREAGVRSLERELGRLARKAAATVASGETIPALDPETLKDWLGRPKVVDDVPERVETPGVATGLAVTGAGGDVLFIETTAFPTGAPDPNSTAEPGLTLTGQLGDVMKESAQIALNFVRSHAVELGINPEAMRRRFHVHVPAGAVPKDGPSAGITMTTALVSLLRDQPVKPTVGMTGEITLQGSVLPIGGLKQKVLAAHRAGLTEVVLPKRNAGDIDDVPEAVRNEMTFHLADTYADVVKAAFATV
jgi:ATP-dependent Lon protease